MKPKEERRRRGVKLFWRRCGLFEEKHHLKDPRHDGGVIRTSDSPIGSSVRRLGNVPSPRGLSDLRTGFVLLDRRLGRSVLRGLLHSRFHQTELRVEARMSVMNFSWAARKKAQRFRISGEPATDAPGRSRHQPAPCQTEGRIRSSGLAK